MASRLVELGFECFLPKHRVLRRWSDRMKEREQPLFPGYLFSRFDFQNRRPLVMTPGVIQVVGGGRTPVPIEQSEIDGIQQAVASGLPSQPWPYLEAGKRVKLIYSKLSGLEGILVNFKGNHRVVLSVTLLQRSVALEVDLSWVVPVVERASVRAAGNAVHQAAPVPVAG